MFMPMLISNCQNTMAAPPTATHDPKRSRAFQAITSKRANNTPYNKSRNMIPTNPHSSANTEKTKSVCFSGRKSS